MKKRVLLGLFLALGVNHAAVATIIVFQNDLAGFEATAGPTPIAIDFDSIATGTDLSGSSINGVSFSSPSSNTLEVVDGLSTFTDPLDFSGIIDASTNRLFPTSGANVLSPGGLELVPGPATAEQDSLRLDFASPVAAFGIDILFQSLDFGPNTSFQVFDAASNQLANVGINTSFAGPGGSPGGAFFLGLYSDDPGTHFSRVVITEFDGNNVFPDSNIGYDSIRLNAIPLPGAFWLFASALVGIFGLRRTQSSD